MSVCPFSISCFSYESKILYIPLSFTLNIPLERCKRRQTLRVRKHTFEPWGGSEGGRVLLAAAAASSSAERLHTLQRQNSHTPQRKGWTRKSSLTAQETERRHSSHERWWELDRIIRSALFMDELNFQRSSCSTIGVNYLSPASCVSGDSILAFFKIRVTDLDKKLHSFFKKKSFDMSVCVWVCARSSFIEWEHQSFNSPEWTVTGTQI